MDSETYRRHLEREITAYAAGLREAQARGAWESPVPSCPGWTIRDLTDHLIGIHYWVRDAIGGKTGADLTPPASTDGQLPLAFEASSTLLLEALDLDPATPCWTFAEDQSLGFWQRRQPHEHHIHRWDLETALGLTADLDTELAADGIDEVVAFFWPRQVALGRADAPADQLALTTTDTGQSWLIGHLAPTDEPVGTLSARAEDLLLALWKRLPADHPSLTWSGDRVAGATVLGLKIVP